MQKKYLILLLGFLVVSVFAQRHEFRKPGPYRPLHPLISALESPDFSPEERVRLKALAEKDPKAFAQEMRTRFLLRRKKEAMEILRLRKAVLDAKDPAAKEKAVSELKETLRNRAEQRLKFHQKVLDETEKNLKLMQQRCEKLRKEYKEQTRQKEDLLEKEMKDILSPTPPERLLKNADWSPENQQKKAE